MKLEYVYVHRKIVYGILHHGKTLTSIKLVYVTFCSQRRSIDQEVVLLHTRLFGKFSTL